MGGNKKAHRTKGNVKPSSSRRTAELLSVNGNKLKGPLCFSELSADLPSYVPPVGLQTDDVDSAVDGNFRMVMRKMTKRDATTKLKAMQEFAELCKNKDEEIVKGILMFWPRLYNKMAVDCDRRVREATHQAHEQLVLKVGRSLAPQLRAIMGVWLASQCDPYAPAASSAKVSFNAAFPSFKQSEACLFCKEEVFTYFTDVLFQHTPESLSDERITPKEEMEAKYIRMISCCLLGMEVFIRTVKSEERTCIEETVSKFLTENKFWKYAKNKEPLIRKSWYTLIICLYQCIPSVLGCHSSKLCPATLGCLAESDPVVAPAVWEAALYSVVTFEDCWQNVNIKKMVLPQLHTLLQEGGSGNAVILFPNLLPLLSKIPDDINKETEFYREFFSNLKCSLSSDKVKNSLSELNAIIRAYLECLEYVISCKLDETNNGFSLLEDLVLNQLLPFIQSSFVEPDSCLAMSCFYLTLGEMLKHIELKIQNLRQNEQQLVILKKFLSLFWDNFLSICCSVLKSQTEIQAKSHSRLAQFFRFLHCSKDDRQQYKKNRFSGDCKVIFQNKHNSRVTFKDDLNSQSGERFVSLRLSNQYEQSDMYSIDSYIVSSTYKLCKIVFEILQNDVKFSYLKLFTEMVRAVPSEELFAHILNGFEGWNGNKQEAPLVFFDKVIPSWLAPHSNEVKEDCIVDLIFSICSCLNMETSIELLNKLCKMRNPVLLHCVLRKALDSCIEDPVLKKWLQSQEIGETMVAIATTLSQPVVCGKSSPTFESLDAMWKCLSICFRSSENLEPLLLPSYLEQILGILHTCLKSGISEELELRNALHLSEFACELASTLFSTYQGCLKLSAAEDLLMTLFSLSCQCSEYPLPEVLEEKIINSWQEGIRHLVPVEGHLYNNSGFLYKAAKKIHDLVTVLSSIESSERLVQLSLKLLLAANEVLCDNNEEIHPAVFDLLDIMLLSDSEWKAYSLKLYRKCFMPAFCGVSLFHIPEEQLSTQQDKIPLCHSLKAYFISDVLVKLVTFTNQKSVCERGTSALLRYLPHVIFAKVCCTIDGDDTSATVKVLDQPDKSLLKSLTEDLSSLLNMLNEKEQISLLLKLQNLSLKDGYFWALVLHHAIEVLKEKNPFVKSYCTDLVNSMNGCDSITQFHTLQALIPHLSPELVAKLAAKSSNFLVCSEDLFALNGVLGHLVIICNCMCYMDVSKFPVIHEDISAVVEFFIGLKKTKVDFLCDCALSSTDETAVCFINQIALFLSSVVHYVPNILSSEQWDFILCTLVGWLQTTDKSKNYISDNAWATQFVEHSCLLLRNVCDLLEDPESKKTQCLIGTELFTEWKDLYSNIIYTIVLPLFVELSEKSRSLPLFDVTHLERMASALENLPPDCIMRCPFPVKTSKIQDTDCILQLPEYVHYLLNNIAPLLTHEVWSVQLGAHCLLMKVMGKLPETVIQDSDDKRIDREENSCAPPAALEHILKETTYVVETMLCDIRVGDSCIVKPFTDAYTYATAYLLTWMEVLEFFSASSSESRSAYACYLRDSGLLHCLLSNLFRLMPTNPVLRATNCDNKKQSSSPCKGTHARTMFTEKPKLLFNVTPGLEELQHLACQVYLCALKKVPALVRQWWNNQDKRTADIVNRFTSKYVSNCICAQEIQAVHDADTKFTNMTVKARPAAREVVATYIIDEMSIELSIQLPSNHPLGPVSVESQRRVGVSQTQWRNWMLQLTTFLTHQNGSILDGLALWKRSVDKRFEGAEECMICFYVLHGSTYQLPRLTCRTCKKKFHSPCLYKWFSMSNNSTCPLCRNLF